MKLNQSVILERIQQCPYTTSERYIDYNTFENYHLKFQKTGFQYLLRLIRLPKRQVSAALCCYQPWLVRADRKKSNFPCFTCSKWSVRTTASSSLPASFCITRDSDWTWKREGQMCTQPHAHTHTHTHTQPRSTLHPLYKHLLNHILIST